MSWEFARLEGGVLDIFLHLRIAYLAGDVSYSRVQREYMRDRAPGSFLDRLGILRVPQSLFLFARARLFPQPFILR